MSIKLYVGNLSFQTSSEDLRDLFSQAGTVESASVVEDRDTGRSRGFGFVEMGSREEGEAAIAQFNGKEFGGRNLTVNEARPREDRGGGGGRGGFGGGGNRGGGGFGGGRLPRRRRRSWRRWRLRRRRRRQPRAPLVSRSHKPANHTRKRLRHKQPPGALSQFSRDRHVSGRR